MAFPVQQVQLPNIDRVPPPLMMDDPNSFAHYTFTTRWPAVVERVIRENAYRASVAERLQQLSHELFHGAVRSLTDSDAPDRDIWEQDLAPYRDCPWVEVPWLFAEFYFYRRILEATDYFRHSSDDPGADPFTPQKQSALRDAVAQAARPAAAVIPSLHGALWGNRADLSLKPDQAWRQDSMAGSDQQTLGDQLLIDQTQVIEHYLQQDSALTYVDIIADNAGAELISDMALAASLLKTYPKLQVRLHLKAYPTFVSDATLRDARQTLAAIADYPLAAELSSHLESGALQFQHAPLWNRPLGFWQMQPAIATALSGSRLAILKGDANYRRLLGDCHWPLTASYSAIAAYFPVPVAALRTLKSELVVGMTPERIAHLERADPSWMTTGEWGVIQARAT